MSLDDFVRLVIAEKIAAARTAQSVRPCAARAEPQACLAVLEWMQQAAGPGGEGAALERGRPATPAPEVAGETPGESPRAPLLPVCSSAR